MHFEAAQIEERLASVCAKEVATRSMSSRAAKKARAAAAAAEEASSNHPAETTTPSKTAMTSQQLREKLRQPASPKPPTTPQPSPSPSLAGGGAGEGSRKGEGGEVTRGAQAAGGGGGSGGPETGAVVVAGGGDGTVSEAEARDSLLGPCRSAYAHAVLTCPHNLRWKVCVCERERQRQKQTEIESERFRHLSGFWGLAWACFESARASRYSCVCIRTLLAD